MNEVDVLEERFQEVCLKLGLNHVVNAYKVDRLRDACAEVLDPPQPTQCIGCKKTHDIGVMTRVQAVVRLTGAAGVIPKDNRPWVCMDCYCDECDAGGDCGRCNGSFL